MAPMRFASGRPWAAALETISCSSGRRSLPPADSSRSSGRSFASPVPLIARVDANPGQVDRWLLGELDQLIDRATAAMDGFQFDETMKAIRAFAWDVLADNYIELVKARLYGPDGPEKRAAQNTLYTALETIAKLMAPFTPFLSEEIYHSLTGESVHVQSWPEPSGTAIDPAGLAIKEIAAALRRYKAEKGMALNSPLPGIVVYSDLALETFDLVGVANSPVESRIGKPQDRDEARGRQAADEDHRPQVQG